MELEPETFDLLEIVIQDLEGRTPRPSFPMSISVAGLVLLPAPLVPLDALLIEIPFLRHTSNHLSLAITLSDKTSYPLSSLGVVARLADPLVAGPKGSFAITVPLESRCIGLAGPDPPRLQPPLFTLVGKVEDVYCCPSDQVYVVRLRYGRAKREVVM